MTTILTIAAIAAVILAFLSFRLNQRLKAQARQCAKEAQRFHDRLQSLIAPSHLFTDEEVHQLKRDFAPLLDKVNRLYDNRFISNEYLDKLGLKEFMDERRLVNHLQYQNNQTHQPSDSKKQ